MSDKAVLKRIGSWLLDVVYPENLYCVCCHKIIDETRRYRLCNDCMDEIKWATGRSCDKCGKLLSDNNPSDTCFSCREHRHYFDKGYCCTEYGAHERKMVYAMKYDNRPDIAKPIGEIMADRINYLMETGQSLSHYDLVVPVPVSRNKLLTRGYNQAALAAESMSGNSDLPYRGEILQRRQDTAKMKGLTPDERRENIRGCFDIIQAKAGLITGADCLVIDDIYTTGATIDEMARTLKAAGANKVDFLSFASGADVIKS